MLSKRLHWYERNTSLERSLSSVVDVYDSMLGVNPSYKPPSPSSTRTSASIETVLAGMVSEDQPTYDAEITVEKTTELLRSFYEDRQKVRDTSPMRDAVVTGSLTMLAVSLFAHDVGYKGLGAAAVLGAGTSLVAYTNSVMNGRSQGWLEQEKTYKVQVTATAIREHGSGGHSGSSGPDTQDPVDPTGNVYNLRPPVSV